MVRDLFSSDDNVACREFLYQVRIVAVGEAERELGVVTRAKDGLTYCFIRCCDREEQIFMHMSEVFELAPPRQAAEETAAEGGAGGGEDGEEAPTKSTGGRDPRKAAGSGGTVEVANGDEVSFNVVENRQDGRLNAVRVLKVPKGTASFQTVLPDRIEGCVARLPPAAPAAVGVQTKKAKDKDVAFKGLIQPAAPVPVPLKDGSMPRAAEREGAGKGDEAPSAAARGGKLLDAEAGMVAWSAADLSNPALVLEKGDTVEFTVIIDRPTKRLRAERVALVKACLGDESGEPSKSEAEQGAVISVKHRPKAAGGSYGYIRSKDGDKRVAFMFDDVDAASLLAAAASAKGDDDQVNRDRKRRQRGWLAQAHARAHTHSCTHEHTHARTHAHTHDTHVCVNVWCDGA
jgi:hypothetical protein